MKTVSASAAGVTRRFVRSGTHRWRVVGFDADGAKIVAAQRSFRVVIRCSLLIARASGGPRAISCYG